MHGIVQFPPREGDAGGKAVRNITIQQAGFGPTAVKVSATLWPSHKHVEVEQGDVVTLEGKYSSNKGTVQQGENAGKEVTYHNLSVSRISVNGAKADSGVKEDTVNDEAAADTDDIPF